MRSTLCTGMLLLMACAGESDGDPAVMEAETSAMRAKRILCEAHRDLCESQESIDECTARVGFADDDPCGELRIQMSQCYIDFGTCQAGILLLFDPAPCRPIIDALSACQGAPP